MEQKEFAEYSMHNGISLWSIYIQNQMQYLDDALLFIINENSDKRYSRDDSSILFDWLNEQIKRRLEFYNQFDLSCLFVLLRQKYRAGIDSNHEAYWVNMRYFKIMDILLECSQNSKIDFVGHSIGDDEAGWHNLISAFSFADAFSYLKEKSEVLMPYREKISISEFISLTDTQYNEDNNKNYFENNRIDTLVTIPEDYVITNIDLERKVSFEKKSLTIIESELDNFFLKYLGISFEMMKKIGCYPMVHLEEFRKYEIENFPNGLIFLYKDDLYEHLTKKIEDIKEEDFDNFLKIFQIKSSILRDGILQYEAIIESNNLLVFGPYDLMQNVTIFINLCKSGQYKVLFRDEGDQNIDKISESMRIKMTDYFVICICDMFISHSYIVPRNNGVPMYEIKKIVTETNINILHDVGDIDLLVLNLEKKIIYNIEAKYYQPAKSYKEMRYSDERRVKSKETIKKVKAREEKLKTNMNAVMKLFNIDNDLTQYKVESLIITARENFYLANSEEVTTLNWTNFCKKIRNNQLE